MQKGGTDMKKTYEKLQIEVIAFDKKDVITASGISDNDNTYKSLKRMMTTNDFESFFTK